MLSIFIRQAFINLWIFWVTWCFNFRLFLHIFLLNATDDPLIFFIWFKQILL